MSLRRLLEKEFDDEITYFHLEPVISINGIVSPNSHLILKFDNNYGASIIIFAEGPLKNPLHQQQYEIALIDFTGCDNYEYQLINDKHKFKNNKTIMCNSISQIIEILHYIHEKG